MPGHAVLGEPIARRQVETAAEVPCRRRSIDHKKAQVHVRSRRVRVAGMYDHGDGRSLKAGAGQMRVAFAGGGGQGVADAVRVLNGGLLQMAPVLQHPRPAAAALWVVEALRRKARGAVQRLQGGADAALQVDETGFDGFNVHGRTALCPCRQKLLTPSKAARRKEHFHQGAATYCCFPASTIIAPPPEFPEAPWSASLLLAAMFPSCAWPAKPSLTPMCGRTPAWPARPRANGPCATGTRTPSPWPWRPPAPAWATARRRPGPSTSPAPALPLRTGRTPASSIRRLRCRRASPPWTSPPARRPAPRPCCRASAPCAAGSMTPPWWSPAKNAA